MKVGPRRACLLLTLFVPFAPVAFGQLIDGAVNPDQIPDVVALRLFLGAIAEPSTPITASSASGLLTPSPRQTGKLAPVGLTPADVSALLGAIGAWQGQLNPGLGRGDLDAVTQDTANTLQVKMSAQGFAALMTYVRSQKKYGSPQDFVKTFKYR